MFSCKSSITYSGNCFREDLRFSRCAFDRIKSCEASTAVKPIVLYSDIFAVASKIPEALFMVALVLIYVSFSCILIPLLKWISTFIVVVSASSLNKF